MFASDKLMRVLAKAGYRAASARGHSREIAESTLTPEGIAAALTAAKVLALTAYDLAPT